jgi:hypothetical protein
LTIEVPAAWMWTRRQVRTHARGRSRVSLEVTIHTRTHNTGHRTRTSTFAPSCQDRITRTSHDISAFSAFSAFFCFSSAFTTSFRPHRPAVFWIGPTTSLEIDRLVCGRPDLWPTDSWPTWLVDQSSLRNALEAWKLNHRRFSTIRCQTAVILDDV